MENQDYKTRTITSTDGRTITYFDGKLHNWDGPALKYSKTEKKKDEYYLYGFQLTKDEWVEARKDRNGVPPDKNPQVKSRF
jgi:hypothetical protein